MFFKTLKHDLVHSDEAPVKFVNTITSEDWRGTIISFLQGNSVPQDEKIKRRMAQRARNYTIIKEDLYWKEFAHHFWNAYPKMKTDGSSMKYTPECASHIGTRALKVCEISKSAVKILCCSRLIKHQRVAAQCKDIFTPPRTITSNAKQHFLLTASNTFSFL